MSKQQEQTICFPGEEAWELWRAKGGVFELAEVAEMEDGSVARPFKSATHFAFPTVAAFAVPVWASSEDKSVVDGVVAMHLEGLGVKPGNPVGELIDHRIALRKDGRSLVLATVLSEGYALSLPRQSPDHFDISARFLVLPSSHITVWKELGRLVLAITRDDQIVHFQALSAEEVDAEAIREIKCLLMQLVGEGVVDSPAGLVLWTPAAEPVIELAQGQLDLRVIQDVRPSPVLPEKGSKLLPTEVAIQRLDAVRRRKIRNVLLGVAALWLIFIGWQIFNFFSAVKEAEKLEIAEAKLRVQAEWIPGFKARWRTLEPAVDIAQYPIDLIHRAVDKLPDKGVRFTAFVMEGPAITIRGEASDSRQANSYGGLIMGSDDLNDYDWGWEKRPSPNTKRKDGTYEFAIFGKSRYATPSS